MEIQVNGTIKQVAPEALSLEALLSMHGVDPAARGIAVAVNQEVIPRAEWSGHQLNQGDVVEIITARQGG